MRALLLACAATLAACNLGQSGPPPTAPAKPAVAQLAQPALAVDGTFSDGTPVTLDALKGRPWVVHLWLPG